MVRHILAIPLFALLLLAACAAPQEPRALADGAVVVPGDAMPFQEMQPSEGTPAVDLGTPDVTFVLSGENYKFMMDGADNPELRVKAGDIVRIEFTSTNGFHDWKVDEFGAATERVQTGGTTSVEFVADKAGTFEYYCSVGQHRANGMKGNLIVE